MEHQEFGWQTTDSLRLFAQEWQPAGPAQGAVCLVHGLGEHSGRYAHVAGALNQAGYAVLAMDLRGHGRSQGPRGHTPSYEILMDDIGHLLEEAARRYPQRPCFLYGHSMGGNLVLNYTLRHRPSLAGVIATSPWLRLAFEPSGPMILLGRIMQRLWPALTQPNGLDVNAISHDPAAVRAYQADPLVHDRISARLGTGVMENGRWALAQAADFSWPLLLVHGSADAITSAEASREFANRAPQVAFKLWEGLYHETHNEPEQQAVLAVIVGWLQAHTPAQ